MYIYPHKESITIHMIFTTTPDGRVYQAKLVTFDILPFQRAKSDSKAVKYSIVINLPTLDYYSERLQPEQTSTA